jgi:1,4-dihydroxy-6-naphthoate synthase
VKRNLPVAIQHKINRLLRNSVEFAFANPSASFDYVKEHAQEMDETVRKEHIALYVNEHSVDLGKKGKHAIEILFQKAKDSGMISDIRKDIFVSSPVKILQDL